MSCDAAAALAVLWLASTSPVTGGPHAAPPPMVALSLIHISEPTRPY